MTTQVGHSIKYRQRDFAIAETTNGENLFNPEDFGISPQWLTTANWSGYICSFGIESDRLLLTGLLVGPPDSGILPEFSGMTPVLAEGPSGYFTYGRLQHEIAFSGGMLIGSQCLLWSDGFAFAYSYEEVWELAFQSGHLTYERDVSAMMAEFRETEAPDIWLDDKRKYLSLCHKHLSGLKYRYERIWPRERDPEIRKIALKEIPAIALPAEGVAPATWVRKREESLLALISKHLAIGEVLYQAFYDYQAPLEFGVRVSDYTPRWEGTCLHATSREYFPGYDDPTELILTPFQIDCDTLQIEIASPITMSKIASLWYPDSCSELEPWLMFVYQYDGKYRDFKGFPPSGHTRDAE